MLIFFEKMLNGIIIILEFYLNFIYFFLEYFFNYFIKYNNKIIT